MFFKNKTLREDERIYLINKRTQNPNAFGMIPSYEMIHKKVSNTIIQEEHSSPKLKKHYNLSMCTLKGNECTLEARQKTREEMQINYNSVLKVEENYFKLRGLSHDVNSLEQI